MMSDTNEKINGEPFVSSDLQLSDAKQQLEKWRKLVEAADSEKSRLLLEKMDTDDAKKKAQQETSDVINDEDQHANRFKLKMKDIQSEINHIKTSNQDLLNKLKHCREQLNAKKADTDNLQQRFKIIAEIPEKKMKFTVVEQQLEDEFDEREHEEDIRAVFTIIQRPSILLKGGEALITFEEEKVADQILRLPKCTVTCDKTRSEVKPGNIILEPCAKFEVHINVSKRTVKFSNADAFLPEERMRDRLELGFSKPSRGGGEVERLEYDAKDGTGHVTFLKTGVAENLTLKGKLYVDTINEMEVHVEPLYGYQLKKFQTFSGVPKRTVLLRGIQDVNDEEDMQDHLEIHFQKPSNYGGEVESIKYVSGGKRLRAFFNEDVEKKEV